ncbi:hypothetical protein HNQ51_001735 [Inhella inkyongensis]|uniref:DUF3102 domain-containing protein n=1 Tax=Inhella inkyongensis TaxID=392593 RepID=A0A840S773_9BURK|nr:hypothetical protein [Inhella inkyongensis]MBB5204421.1 hypothetical protein [Inhella inkyongensis]
MPKKPTPALQAQETALAPQVLEADIAAHNQRAVAKLEQNQRVTALAHQLNYQGSTDPAVLENSAQDAIRRLGAAIFELGAYLLLMKEACAHGAFLPALERLGIVPVTAQRYMNVTRRFANASPGMHLEKAGIKKMVELLPLDDEQIGELTELGQTGELALDDVARMSVRELRAAVREIRKDREADATLLEKRNSRIDKLERDLGRIDRLDPADKLAQQQKAATEAQRHASAILIGELRQRFIAVDNAADERAPQTLFLAGLVGQLQADLAALREEFNLPDVSRAADAELVAEVAQWNKTT